MPSVTSCAINNVANACSLSDSILTMQLPSAQSLSSSSLTFLLSLPHYQGTYPLRLLAVSNSVSMFISTHSLVIPAPSFPSSSLVPLLNLKSAPTLLLLSLTLPSDLSPGVKSASDPYSPYSLITLSLNQHNNMFSYNLNINGLVDNQDLGCKYMNLVAESSSSLSCRVSLGKQSSISASDHTMISI